MSLGLIEALNTSMFPNEALIIINTMSTRQWLYSNYSHSFWEKRNMEWWIIIPKRFYVSRTCWMAMAKRQERTVIRRMYVSMEPLKISLKINCAPFDMSLIKLRLYECWKCRSFVHSNWKIRFLSSAGISLLNSFHQRFVSSSSLSSFRSKCISVTSDDVSLELIFISMNLMKGTRCERLPTEMAFY